MDKAYHLEELTNQFFDITRFNLQEIPLNKTEIHGEFFLEQITDEALSIARAKRITDEIEMYHHTLEYMVMVTFWQEF